MPRLDKMDPQTETLNRVRRIETRLTAALIAMGVDTQSQHPAFVDLSAGKLPGRGKVQLPSPHSSFKEILACIPTMWAGECDIMVGDDFFGRLVVARRT